MSRGRRVDRDGFDPRTLQMLTNSHRNQRHRMWPRTAPLISATGVPFLRA